MKLKKCWLSAGLTAALLVSLNTYVVNGGAPVGERLDTLGPELDASVFAKDSTHAEKHQFGAEVSRLLKILTNSVYTDRKAVVRELLSNAVDAIGKQHDKQLAKAATGADLDDISNYKVVVEVNKESRVLSFTDDGVGMTHDELKSFLGTIAKSGTAEFAFKNQKGGDPSNMIGQFGVGFYSVLLVAEKVAVISKNDNDPKQWIWETDTSAAFRISEDPNGPTLKRGTRVMLKLKEEAAEFLDHDKLEKIMKEYFGHDRHRIYLIKPKTITEEVPVEEKRDEMNEEEGDKDKKKKKSDEKEGEPAKVGDESVQVEEETKEDEKPKTKKIEKIVLEEVLISQNVKPIWLRSPADVKSEEYEALYKTVSGDKYGKPIAYTHFSGETGKGEAFRAVLFIPERPPFSPFAGQEHQLDIKLHVRGVFVTAKFEDFVPKYLSFVKGVIDSEDLSLNISREILQNTAELRGIRKKVVKKIIEMMADLADDKEKYKKFYDSYSSFIKMEVSEREDNRALLSKLLRYRTSKSGEQVRSLDEYIEAMPEGQKQKKAIYFLAGKADEVEKSPLLGRFTEKGYEVILMTEPVDEHTIQKLEKYEDYKFENIAKEGIKLDEDEEKEMKEYDEKYKTAKEWLVKVLKNTVEKIVFVSAPEKIPGTMKSSQFGWTGNMERLIMAQSSVKEDPMLQFFSKQKKILELNPKNEIVKEFFNRINNQDTTKEFKAMIRTWANSLLISSGFSVPDPNAFSSGMDRMMRELLGLSVEPLQSEAEEKEKDEEKELDMDEDISLGSMDSDDKGGKPVEEKASETKEEESPVEKEESPIEKEKGSPIEGEEAQPKEKEEL